MASLLKGRPLEKAIHGKILITKSTLIMKEIEEAARKSTEERRRVLNEQVENLQKTNVANIQELKEALMPIVANFQKLIMALRQESINLQEQQIKVTTGIQMMEQQKAFLDRRISDLRKMRLLLNIKVMALAIMIGLISGLGIFLILFYRLIP